MEKPKSQERKRHEEYEQRAKAARELGDMALHEIDDALAAYESLMLDIWQRAGLSDHEISERLRAYKYGYNNEQRPE